MTLQPSDHLRHFTAVIDGRTCTGQINHVVCRYGYHRYYLCQNETPGCNDHLLEGYKYSWVVDSPLRDFSVRSFKFVGATQIMGDIIKYSSSFNQFLEDSHRKSKVSEMLYNYDHTTVSQIDYITNRGILISYLPHGKECVTTPDGYWGRENRQDGKPAKVARKLFTEEGLKLLTDKDFEIFSNLYKAMNDDDGEFRIVRGEDIRKWYHYKMYAENTGSLDSSCMRYTECQDYFDIYCHNSQVSMLILVKDEKLLARAIIWHYEKFPILDRVYGSDSHRVRFHEWAQDNGYCYRTESGSLMYQCDDISDQTIEIPLDTTLFRYTPYVDTFKYLYKGRVSNRYLHRASDYIEEMQSTTGGGGRTVCDNCDSTIEENDAYVTDDGETLCEDCRGYCNHNEESILARDERTCDWNGNTYHRNYIVETVDGEDVYENHPSLISLEDGDYCHVDKSFTCEYDNCTYHESEKVSIDIDGEYYTIHEDNEDDWKEDNVFTCDHDGEEHLIRNRTELVVDGKRYKLWDDNVDDWMEANVVTIDGEEHLKSSCTETDGIYNFINEPA